MKVLIACEFSGRVRDAFLALGYDAISCDLLPTESPGPHICGDVLPLLREPWDLIIAHPPCTYMANSGVRWLYEKLGRWELMREGAVFFKQFLDANSPRIAVENPVMHRHAAEIIGHRQDFSVQPWQFGDPFRKRTCFWTIGLPALVPTTPEATADGTEAYCHMLGPSPDRWKLRSMTYPGIANALADQYGAFRSSTNA